MCWSSRAVRARGSICERAGEWADAAFGGCASLPGANRLMRLMRLPRWVAAAAQATGRGLTRWTRDWGRQVSKAARLAHAGRDRKSTRLNSSHITISYAVFCLKKKKK